MRLSRTLSEQVFTITDEEALNNWLRVVEKDIGGIMWLPLGGIENNVHTVEVASDPALALVERPINSIDALLDLKAQELKETAPSPHEASRKWWGMPAEGLTALAVMEGKGRRELDEHIRERLAGLISVTMVESGDSQRPTIDVRDQGTGQHPDAWDTTHLSLLRSNKKHKMYQMGVYNAGGAASYRFAKATIIISRLAPGLLDGHVDEIGVSVVRYNALDPDKFKSGVYEYMSAKDKTIVRLGLDSIPGIEYGTHVRFVEYEIPKYARAAHEPKQSLWHLFHAALPDPALPFRIVETRKGRFPAIKGEAERRTVMGLLYLLSRPGIADYSDVRTISLGPDGFVTLRYFVLNEGHEPDAYTTSEQGLTIMLNGQRQITKDRYWIKRNLELFYLYKRLVVVVDATRLSNAAKRMVFTATREHGVDSPLTKTILDRVIRELQDDEDLSGLEEQAKQRTLQDATKTTTEKVKRQLATQIAAYLKGEMVGTKGGRRKVRKKRRKPGPRPPITFDDSTLPEVPDKLNILTDPLRIERGDTAPLRLEINAKNGFLPKYAGGLSVIFGPELKDHVKVLSQGRLLGGRVRITLEAGADAPTVSSSMKVALVVPELAVLLTAEGTVQVVEPKEEEKEDSKRGGEPNVEINWVGREKWDGFDPAWDEETVGDCLIYRDDPVDKTAITKVEWVLNRAFGPYEKVVEEKKLGESTLKAFEERYEYPVALGLFRQRLAEEAKEREADEQGGHYEIPDDYVKGEKARLARGVLMALEPEVTLAEVAAAG